MAVSYTHLVMADDASIYVFHADTEGLNFRKAFDAAGFYLSGCCIWKKQSLVLGRSPYQWQHEPCLYGWKKKGKHQWYTCLLYTSIAPHIYFTQFMNDNDRRERDLALFMDIVLLSKCAELWVFGEKITSGMSIEIEKAKRKGQLIRYFTENCEEVHR